MWCLAPRRYLKLIQDGEKMVPVWTEPPGQSCLDPAGRVKTSFLTKSSPWHRWREGVSERALRRRMSLLFLLLPSPNSLPCCANHCFRPKSAAENKAEKNCQPSWALYSNGGNNKSDKLKI